MRANLHDNPIWVNFTIDRIIKEKFQVAAKAAGRSMSSLVQEFMMMYIKNNERLNK